MKVMTFSLFFIALAMFTAMSVFPMFPASSKSQSLNFPDVCKTPTAGGPVPLPYPNLSKSSDFNEGTKKVKGGGNIKITKVGVPNSKGKQSAYELGVFDQAGKRVQFQKSTLIQLEDGTYCAVCMKNGLITGILKLQGRKR